mmetsp:Transcript_11434/g.26388  ORF Transcript_11434/g.26388 Transcript_11434/m.26388 type:complete len:221 (-) Transcript_11434:107-769(-)
MRWSPVQLLQPRRSGTEPRQSPRSDAFAIVVGTSAGQSPAPTSAASGEVSVPWICTGLQSLSRWCGTKVGKALRRGPLEGIFALALAGRSSLPRKSNQRLAPGQLGTAELWASYPPAGWIAGMQASRAQRRKESQESLPRNLQTPVSAEGTPKAAFRYPVLGGPKKRVRSCSSQAQCSGRVPVERRGDLAALPRCGQGPCKKGTGATEAAKLLPVGGTGA